MVHLRAGSLVHARIGRTPIHVRFAVLPGVTGRAVTGVVLDVVDARRSVSAGHRIAFVDTRLAVATGVPVKRETRDPRSFAI